MNLVISKFNYGGITANAIARLYGPPPKSNLDQPLLLDIDVQYTIFHNASTNISPSENQILIWLPSHKARLIVEFLRTRPEFTDQSSWLPDKDKYQRKIAELLANMVETAELKSLDDDVPKLIGAETIIR